MAIIDGVGPVSPAQQLEAIAQMKAVDQALGLDGLGSGMLKENMRATGMLKQKAQDTFVQGKGGVQVNMNGQSNVGTQQSAPSPHSQYSQQQAKTQGTYFVPLQEVGSMRVNGKGRPFSGKSLAKGLDKGLKNNPEKTKKYMPSQKSKLNTLAGSSQLSSTSVWASPHSTERSSQATPRAQPLQSAQAS